MRIWHIEFSGFAGTELHTDRINGVHLLYKDGRLTKEQRFKTLKLRVAEDYGAPSIEHALESGRICFWRFPSGSILLTSYSNGLVSLAYMQNSSGMGYQTPLQN